MNPLPEFTTDPLIYRIVIGVLGLLVLIVALGAVGLMMFSGKDIPQGILALASAAVGGLVGLLVPMPMAKKQ